MISDKWPVIISNQTVFCIILLSLLCTSCVCMYFDDMHFRHDGGHKRNILYTSSDAQINLVFHAKEQYNSIHTYKIFHWSKEKSLNKKWPTKRLVNYFYQEFILDPAYNYYQIFTILTDRDQTCKTSPDVQPATWRLCHRKNHKQIKQIWTEHNHWADVCLSGRPVVPWGHYTHKITKTTACAFWKKRVKYWSIEVSDLKRCRWHSSCK